MNRLLKKNIIPPEGFRFREFATGFVVTGGDYWTWIQNITAHRMANGLPVDRLTIEIDAESQLCSTLPPGWCEEWDPGRSEPLTRVTWGDVLEGMKVFTKWFREGRKYVSQEEAERRAAICSPCYLNVNIEGCGACRKLSELIAGDVHSSKDAALVSCGICKCSIAAKIHFPLNVLAESTEKHQRFYQEVPHCWLNKKSENYVAE